MKEILLSTERLHIRFATPDDVPFILELLNGTDWINNIGDRQIRTHEDALKYIETKFHGYKPGIGCNFIIALKDTNAAIGSCGIFERGYTKTPDIGFSLLPAYYKLGYAFEANDALLKHARKTWGITQISGIVLPSNLPSIRLLEKLGLSYQSPIEIPNDPEVLHLYVGE